MRKVNDPIPRRAGRPMNPFLPMAVAAVVVILCAPAFYLSSGEGYGDVKRLASVKCLGCLGLDPVVPGFKSFWTDYPSGHAKQGQEVPHPSVVLSALDRIDTSIVVLFFWTQGCVPCAEQWEEMREEDIASGPEDGGREGDRYDELTMFSLDASITDPIDIEFNGTAYPTVPNDLFWTYHYTGDPSANGVPATVFMFKKSGTVNWYMFYGKMDIDVFEGMMTRILYHEIAHSS